LAGFFCLFIINGTRKIGIPAAVKAVTIVGGVFLFLSLLIIDDISKSYFAAAGSELMTTASAAVETRQLL